MHKAAEKAAIAALAGAKQDKYREISKILFTNYKKLNDKTIKTYAEKVGLDMDRFNKDIKHSSLRKMVQADMKTGKSVKVRGVPAIFINGRIVKDRSIKGLSRMVEEELKKSK